MDNLTTTISAESSSNTSLILPKSRKVQLGSGFLPPSFGLTDYLYYFYDCRLPKELKRTLMYFASRFNWKKRKPSYVSLSRAANDLGVGRKYLGKDLKELERLGWVSLEVKKSTQTYSVQLLIGNEIEDQKWQEQAAKTKQLETQNDYD